MGENVGYYTKNILEESYMVKLNITISANVRFITNDAFDDLLSTSVGVKCGDVFVEYQMGTIEAMGNVVIGINTMILYNTRIGPMRLLRQEAL